MNLMKHSKMKEQRDAVFDCMKSTCCMDGSQRGAASPLRPLSLRVGRPHGETTPPCFTHHGCRVHWKGLAEG